MERSERDVDGGLLPAHRRLPDLAIELIAAHVDWPLLLARQRQDVETARAFLTALKAASIEPQQEVAGNSIAEWIAWAESRLARADPLNRGVDAVFEAIAAVTTWTYRD